MPYKDINKAREANRKSYRKYAEARNRAVAKYRKNNPEKLTQFRREHNWKRSGIINLDGSRFRMNNYLELFALQNGKCAITCCPNQPSDFKKIFDVDHDHTTGIVRGLLCGEHNKTLGKVNDSIDELQELINYLKFHKLCPD